MLYSVHWTFFIGLTHEQRFHTNAKMHKEKPLFNISCVQVFVYIHGKIHKYYKRKRCCRALNSHVMSWILKKIRKNTWTLMRNMNSKHYIKILFAQGANLTKHWTKRKSERIHWINLEVRFGKPTAKYIEKKGKKSFMLVILNKFALLHRLLFINTCNMICNFSLLNCAHKIHYFRLGVGLNVLFSICLPLAVLSQLSSFSWCKAFRFRRLLKNTQLWSLSALKQMRLPFCR